MGAGTTVVREHRCRAPLAQTFAYVDDYTHVPDWMFGVEKFVPHGEVDHGLDPRDPADALADPNLNRVTNLDEYRNGNDPHLDAYGDLKPVLLQISGGDQTPRPGQFTTHPMRVRALRPDGTPLAGAPVHFHAEPGEGLLAASNTPDAKLLPVLTVHTDADGYAHHAYTSIQIGYG